MPFIDLSVRVDSGNPHALREHLSSLVELGYAAVALDTRVEATDRNARAVLVAGLAPLDDSVLTAVTRDARKNNANVTELVTLRRVTIQFNEPNELAEFFQSNDDCARRFDLIALEPTSERAFLSSISNRRADLLTVSLGQRSAFKLRAASLKATSTNGIAIEIMYNSSLLDVGSRRNFFANGTSIVRAVGENTGGGVRGDSDGEDDSDDMVSPVIAAGSRSNTLSNKPSKRVSSSGIVLTSGSRQAMELRAPIDVANLATLLGMRDENARAALSVRCVRVVRKARRKRAEERAAAGDKNSSSL